ncbi:hypothetical protein WJX74_001778 [Apatococcus lobatus]|uniref:Coatomer subunit delta n=1 Tax=Apatococcus lobatus TaxID=904363 RepID=A0AAW1QN85_9CHLO
MVVLAASMVTKTGKALVSRQFVDMSRIRIEGLLAAFPKLVGSGTGKQHTYVETENVRYVYQPIEGLYLLLVTNKASNILEDLETLRLLAKVVPEYVMELHEEAIAAAAFDLIFAFDEVISLGHKENVNVQQVKQNTDMDSHEEKLHDVIIKSKIEDTKAVMKAKAREIEASKLERLQAERKGMGMPSSFPGTVSTGGSMRSGLSATDNDLTPTFTRPEPSTFGRSARDLGAAKGPSKGMQLGKAKRTSQFMDSLRAEGELVGQDEAPLAAVGAAAPAPAPPVSTDPVAIVVKEKVTVALDKDGGLENMDVQGSMALTVLAEEAACLRVALSSGKNQGFQFKTHPNIDKGLYISQNLLGLKDPEAPFPTSTQLGILRWRLQTTDESAVPLSINCWPSASGRDSYVNIEYESTASFDLQDVTIAIPLPALASPPRVKNADGDHRYDARKSVLLWTIDLIDDSNKNGSMEFVVPATSDDSFFPVDCSFHATKTLCQVKIESVTNTQSGAPIKYALQSELTTDSYQVV